MARARGAPSPLRGTRFALVRPIRSLEVALVLHNGLSDWLRPHVCGGDVQLGRFLLSRRGG